MRPRWLLLVLCLFMHYHTTFDALHVVAAAKNDHITPQIGLGSPCCKASPDFRERRTCCTKGTAFLTTTTTTMMSVTTAVASNIRGGGFDDETEGSPPESDGIGDDIGDGFVGGTGTTAVKDDDLNDGQEASSSVKKIPRTDGEDDDDDYEQQQELDSVSASEGGTYTLGIRDSLMIAHSFHNHPAFGIAGGLHGATYTCDVIFISKNLRSDTNWIIDIGYATDMLSAVLSKYNLKNLDDIFINNEITTTEFMCRIIHTDICQKLREHMTSSSSASSSSEFNGKIRVKLWESHKAWASYCAPYK